MTADRVEISMQMKKHSAIINPSLVYFFPPPNANNGASNQRELSLLNVSSYAPLALFRVNGEREKSKK